MRWILVENVELRGESVFVSWSWTLVEDVVL